MPWFLSSQEIITYDSSFVGPTPRTNVGRIDIGQCSHTDLGEEFIIRQLFDILVTSDGTEYAYGKTQTFQDTTLMINNDPGGGVIEFIDFLTIDINKRGWTCDELGFSYSAGQGITKKELALFAQEQYLGDLPPNMQCQGGLTYRKGRFYLHSINNQLVEVNMKNPLLSKVVMDFPADVLPIDALTTVQVGCDSSVTYAIGRTPTNSKIYEVDFTDWSLQGLCDLPISIVGAGSETECMLPPCNILVDLDYDNSSFAFRGDFCRDTFCVPPVSVTDTDVVIVSAFDSLETVTLELTGFLNLGQEYLSLSAANNINILGNNTPFLTLENSGNATIGDFETALQNVQYHNDAADLSFGVRKVLTTVYAGGESSLTAVSELPLSNEQMITEPNILDPSCHGFADGSVSLSSYGGVAPFDYSWDNGTQGAFLDNLSQGTYVVSTVDALGCEKIDTIVLVEPDTLIPSITYSGLPAICDSSGSLEGTAVGGTMPYSYSWSNGTMDSINLGLNAGQYELSVEDTNGCIATAIFEIPEGDTVLVVQDETICAGESILWKGVTYSSDTLACLVYSMPNGCDSTVCLSLSVLPLPAVAIEIQGSLCDQDEVTLLTGPYSSYQWSTGEGTPQITVSSPGDYGVTVTDSLGCQGSASQIIDPTIDFDITFGDPSCFERNDGFINVETVSGGVPPINYSIDGGFQLQANGQFFDLSPGDYEIVIEDATGCTKTSFITLAEPDQIILDAGGDLEISLGESVQLEAFTTAVDPSVNWSPPDFLDCPQCLTTSVMPLSSVTYEIEVQDSNGCSTTDQINITVNDESSFFTPNVFSPNGDGINEFFTVYTGPSVVSIASLKIFDRWGGLLFDKKNLTPNTSEEGWDGSVKGDPAHAGVYVFLAELLLIDGRSISASGEVSLIR
ncbi:MAG: gliding motility-associated C-terminal domain-containing protein [Bacteroidota bacterium]